MPKSAPSIQALGAAIAELRQARRVAQDALARDADITPSYLSGIERGKRNPSWEVVGQIADALGSDMDELAREAIRHEEILRFSKRG
jgi:transcriptional regulator with XRE-family HTH domain